MKKEFPPQITLDPIKKISGTLKLPGSKSLSNRVLLLSMLAEGTTRIENLLDSDDVHYMKQALEQLGVKVHSGEGASVVEVEGTGGVLPSGDKELFLGNAGTAMRSLTAAMCLAKGAIVLDGIQRMRERPIGDLVDALEQWGARIKCRFDNRCPPLEIKADGLRGGKTIVSGAISSQYLSALLMVAPFTKETAEISIRDSLVSVPYVEMTIRLMEQFGVNVKNQRFQNFFVPSGQRYQSPGTIRVEGDASSASYFLAGAAITKGSVRVEGCGQNSVQGDVHFASVLEQMGAKVTWEPNAITLEGRPLKGIDIDMNKMPDVAMTLAMVACFAEGETVIRNIYNWRVKETDRLAAVATELQKLGAKVEEGRDFLRVSAPEAWKAASIETYDDHRIAMMFSLAACSGTPVTILDPKCVSKTFPDYFEQLEQLITWAPGKVKPSVVTPPVVSGSERSEK